MPRTNGHSLGITPFLFNALSESYTEFIGKYARSGDLGSGKALHARLIINGLARRTHFAAKLITFYAECKQVNDARKLFDKIPKTNARRWIVLAGAYSRQGIYEEVMGLFKEMQEARIRPNKFVLPSVLKACGHLSDRRTGESLHAVILKNEFESDAYVVSALIDMYSKCGKVEKAKRVFDAMGKKDLVALNAMVSGLVQHRRETEALSLFEEMKPQGLKPNVVTYNALMAGFSQADDMTMASKVFALMQDEGVEPDVVSWTSLVSGLVQNFHNRKAFHVFKQMMNAGILPTSATLSSLLPACASLANMKRGREIHGYAIVMGAENDVYVRSALIDMYAKCGLIYQAGKLFHTMPSKNTVTWNSMIFGYANHGHCDEAIHLFEKMAREEEGKMDHLTFTAALTACSHGGMVKYGESVFKKMVGEHRIIPRLEHYACMVDVLGRGGETRKAYDFIQRMPMEADLFAWGALLGACRQYGDVEIAEVAAKELVKLEPLSAGNGVLLSGLYADVSRWGNVAKVKMSIKKNKKLQRFPGCSWVDVVAEAAPS
ncbi:hypothetical protein DM860_012173 [Cuscuta australis]|uniref:Pentacotripeptide-repeat region of PRORP domain-containing protein n=3 Tax=Cuscuta sect. Cleistogrammica TaxID=1824901 RepID=A0A328DB38_9ASTE|nr:hypothetical protein DM860_012173 [Cuscuta australis]